MGSRSQNQPPLLDDASIMRSLTSDSEALRRAEEWVRRRIYGLSDREARWLYEAYKEAYKNMAAALSNAADSNGNIQVYRRRALLQQIEAEMDRLMQQVTDHMADTDVQAYQQGYAGRAWALDQGTNPDVNIHTAMLPVQAIRAGLLAPVQGKKGKYRGADWATELAMSRDEFIGRVKRSITQSLINGEGMAAAQRRLRDELGIQTDRRQGFKRNFYQTLMLSRTEIMRASNLGALSIYEENQDILSGWEWVATKDERTCPRCGGMDGKRFKFGEAAGTPPGSSHPGCRCTIVPVLQDEDLMNRVAGVRQTYADWAAERGMTLQDGGLAGQKAAQAPKADSLTVYDKAQQENRQALQVARGVTPKAIDAGTAAGPVAAYMSTFFAYDNDGGPMYDRELMASAKNDLLYSVHTLGRGRVTQQVINDVRLQSAGILGAHEQAGEGILTRRERNTLVKLASEDDEKVLKTIDDIRDRRLRGRLSGTPHTSQNYEKFVSAEAEDGAARLRENSRPQWRQ